MPSHHDRRFLPCLAAAALLASLVSSPPAIHAQDSKFRVGERLPASAKSTAAGRTNYREVTWDDLLPKDWDPVKEVRDLNLGQMRDGDRRAEEAMEILRKLWDRAPANAQLENALLKLPGFVVPLEEDKDGLREFLLVPYFGACIHAPPPPANQIIHVVAPRGIKGVKPMDPVWVSGRLNAARSQTSMGESGYRMQGAVVEPYREKSGRR